VVLLARQPVFGLNFKGKGQRSHDAQTRKVT